MTHFSSGRTVGLIGYGEVGRILAEDLVVQGISLIAYDAKFETHAGDSLRTHAQRFGVQLAKSYVEVARATDLVISAVTASQAVEVAHASAQGLRPQAFFLDLNSSSPAAKHQAATAIDAANGRYVEAAIMTSVPPYRIRVPMLLGGRAANDIAPLLIALGFDVKVTSETLGVASATKMCRSVMIKGMEAMVIECFSAARAYGVEDQVIASLAETFPGIDWEAQGDYFFQRAILHGRRRAEEMKEAANTVADVGLTPLSAAATATRQGAMADLADTGIFGLKEGAGYARNKWRLEADRLLSSSRKDDVEN